jgi:hypothetical protein
MKKIENPKKEESADIYENIAVYANRRNVLSKLVLEIQTDGFTPSHIESELASVELADVITDLKGIPTQEAIKILNKQIVKYENLIKRLMK